MFGVPGRPKACLTCRQRKKKVRRSTDASNDATNKLLPCLHRAQCDLQLPFCKTCLDGERMCEGYDPCLAVLIRTRQSVAKREPFGEANLSPNTVPWPASSTLSLVESADVQQRKLPGHRKTVLDSLTLQPRDAIACEAQLISTFWEHYMPQQSLQTACQCAWLQKALGLPDPSPALRLSLKAVAAARLGWIHRDDTLVLHGRMLYVQALQEIQKALYDERTMWQDETLATGNILALYEVGKSP